MGLSVLEGGDVGVEERSVTGCDVGIVFFFQAEDGIRDVAVTGVQTCALPISRIRTAAREISSATTRPGAARDCARGLRRAIMSFIPPAPHPILIILVCLPAMRRRATTDRKSTRLNSSHGYISYAVFCLKKKKTHHTTSNARDGRDMFKTHPHHLPLLTVRPPPIHCIDWTRTLPLHYPAATATPLTRLVS